MPTGNIRSDALPVKVELYDRLDNLVLTLKDNFKREPKKGLFYYPDLVLDLDPGYYRDVWYFADPKGDITTVEQGFILHNSVFAGFPGFKIRPQIKTINIAGDDKLLIVIDTRDPFLWIKDAVFKEFDQQPIEWDWFHEVGEKMFLFKLKKDIKNSRAIEVFLKTEGFDRNEWELNQLIRLKPEIVSR